MARKRKVCLGKRRAELLVFADLIIIQMVERDAVHVTADGQLLSESMLVQ